MARRYLLRSFAFWLCFSAGLGGVAPDIGHLLNLISKGQIAWSFGHSIVFWWGFTLTSLIGFSAISILIGDKGSK